MNESLQGQVLDLIANCLPIGIFTTDRDLHLTYLSGEALKIGGLGAKDSIGTTVGDLLEEFPGKSKLLDNLERGLKGVSTQLHLEWNGHRYQVFIEPTLDSSGAVLGCQGVIVNSLAFLASQPTDRQVLGELDAIYQFAPLGLAVLDPNFRYVRVSNCLAEMLKKPTQEIIGSSIREILPSIAPQIEQIHQSVRETGKPRLRCEIEVPLDSGEQLVWLGSFYPLHSSEQQLIGQAVVVQDITQQRQYESTKQRLAAIVESSQDAIIGKTLEGIITSWNHAAEQIYGYTAAEAIGQSIHLIVPDDRRHEIDEIHKQIRMGQRVPPFETTRRRKDGHFVQISLSISPVFGAGGKIVSASAIARDVTEAKKRKQDYESLVAEMAHHDRISVMGEMTTGLAHELNHPLTAISIHAGVCARYLKRTPQKNQEELLSSLEQIIDQTHRAGDVIRAYRKWATRSRPRRSTVNLNELVEYVSRFLNYEATNQQVKLELNLAPDLPEVMMDRVQIGQVLVNLIRNAFEALSDVAEPRSVKVSTVRRGESIRVNVGDSGVGLPDIGKIPSLFESFQTNKADGLGLGLSICRRIIENHGGRIWAESQSPRGAKFVFELPIS